MVKGVVKKFGLGLAFAGLLGISTIAQSQDNTSKKSIEKNSPAPIPTITKNLDRAYVNYTEKWNYWVVDSTSPTKQSYNHYYGTDRRLLFKINEFKDEKFDALGLSIYISDSLGNTSFLFSTSCDDFRIQLSKMDYDALKKAKTVEYSLDMLTKVPFSKEIKNGLVMNDSYYVPTKTVKGKISKIMDRNEHGLNEFSFASEETLDKMADLEAIGFDDQRMQYIVARLGVTPEKVKALESQGFKVNDFHFGNYPAQVLMHEVVALGTFSKWEADSARDAGFHSIYTFTIDKYFRMPEDLKNRREVKILHVSGPTGGGSYEELMGENLPKVGTKMLLFADRGYLTFLLNYYKGNHKYGPEYMQATSDSPIWDGHNILTISPLETGQRIDGDADLINKMSLDEFVKKFIEPVVNVLDK